MRSACDRTLSMAARRVSAGAASPALASPAWIAVSGILELVVEAPNEATMLLSRTRQHPLAGGGHLAPGSRPKGDDAGQGDRQHDAKNPDQPGDIRAEVELGLTGPDAVKHDGRKGADECRDEHPCPLDQRAQEP